MNTNRKTIGRIAASLGVVTALVLLATCGNTLLEEIREESAARARQETSQMRIVSNLAKLDDGAVVEIGSTAEGATVERDFYVYNDGGAELEIDVVIEDNNLSLFGFSSPAPSRIAPGTFARFVVSFTPQALGDASATLVIESNAPSLPAWTVEITGRGVEAGTVIAPSAGELLLPGQQYNIQWAPFPEGNVTIDLYSGGSLEQEIAADISDSGSQQWTVPTGSDGSAYRVRVTSVLNDAVWNQSGQFSIGTISNASVSSLQAPYVEPGQEIRVQWTTSLSSSETVNIELYRNAQFIRVIDSNAGNASPRDLTIPTDVDNGSGYSIRVVTTKNKDIFAETGPFAIGTITITEPTAGSQWTRGNNYTILWNTGNLGGTVSIGYRRGNGPYIEIVGSASDTPNPISNSGSYTWSIPSSLLPSDDYRVEIQFSQSSNISSHSDPFEVRGGVLSAPSISPTGSYHTASQTVTVTGPTGSRVCFTTNGAVPVAPDNCAAGHQATASVTARTTVVKAFAIRDHWDQSAVVERTYHIPVLFERSIGTSPDGDGPYRFSQPRGIAVSGSEVFVADSGNKKIKVYSSDTLTFLREWSTAGTPHALQTSGEYLIVSEHNPNAVRFYSFIGDVLMEPISGMGAPQGFYFDSTPRIRLAASSGVWTYVRSHVGWTNTEYTNIGLANPVDVASHRIGISSQWAVRHIYVLDRSHRVVRRYSGTMDFELEFDGGEYAFGGSTTGLHAVDGVGMAAGETGVIYVTNTGSNRVQVYGSDGSFRHLFSGGTSPQHVSGNHCVVFVTNRHHVQKFVVNSWNCIGGIWDP